MTPFLLKRTTQILSLLALLLGLGSEAAQALEFRRACDSADDTLLIGGVGDLLMHKYIHNAAQKRKSQYSYLWKNISSHIRGVDIMYANLETPLAAGLARDGSLHKDPGVYWDEREYIYSGYPSFNTPPALAINLVDGGFDIVSTANNHAADRGYRGVDMTIDSLKKANLPFSGTRKKGERHSFTTYIKKKGWKVAFIACTYGVNGYRGESIQSQVLHCYEQKSLLLSEIRNAKRQADAVIVTPHWGSEDSFSPSSEQVNLGREIADAGADAIIGTHAHVIQPMKKYATRDGREVPVFYGTGNFVSSQPKNNKIGLFALIGLSKRGSQVWVNGARYLPLYMINSPTGLEYLDRMKGLSKTHDLVSQVMDDDFGLMNSRERLTSNPVCGD